MNKSAKPISVGDKRCRVNFHLQPGEMAFLTGHSGAGKSTLLKLICGIERPSAGKIFFSGHEISRLKSREVPFLRRQIGMIFGTTIC